MQIQAEHLVVQTEAQLDNLLANEECLKELTAAKALLDAGLLNRSEFDGLKARLLNGA